MADAQACLQTIQSDFDSYRNILDQDLQRCDNLIQSIRKEIFADENEQSKIELVKKLNYLEEEALKTHEENKQCRSL